MYFKNLTNEDIEEIKKFLDTVITYTSPYTRWALLSISRLSPSHYAHSKWGHRFVSFFLFPSIEREIDIYDEESGFVHRRKYIDLILEWIDRMLTNIALDLYLKVNPVNVIKSFVNYAVKLSNWYNEYLTLTNKIEKDERIVKNIQSLEKYISEALEHFRLFGHGFMSPETIDKIIYALVDIDLGKRKITIDEAFELTKVSKKFLEDKLGRVKTVVYTGGGIHILVHIEDKVSQVPLILESDLVIKNNELRNLLKMFKTVKETEKVVKETQSKVIKPVLKELKEYLTNEFKTIIDIDLENSLTAYIRIPATINRKWNVKTRLIEI